MKIGTKLAVSFLAVIALLIVLGLFGLKSIREVNERFDVIADETAPTLHVLGLLKVHALRVQMEALSITLMKGEEELEEEEVQFQKAKEALEAVKAKYVTLAENEEEKRLAEEIGKTEEAMYQAALKLSQLAKASQWSPPEEIQAKKEILEEAEQAFLQVIQKAITIEEAEFKEQDALADRAVSQSTHLTLILSLTALIIAIGLSLLLTYLIARPLVSLSRVTKKFGEGDLSIRAAAVKTKDEIRDLTISFNTMAGSIQKKNEELQTFNEELQTSNEELRSTTEELEATNEEVKSTNEELEAANEELRETQEKLLQQEKLAAVGQLASGVGHELRNPLGVIKNAVYYVRTKVPQDDEKLSKHLRIMEKEIDNSTKIINDLLGFSRTRKPAIAPSDINRIIEETLESLECPPNVHISKELSQKLPPAMVDPDQIRQVFLNLALNGIQAMTEGGMLSVKTYASNGKIKIDFKDNGCGIPQENTKKLFDPFFTTKSRGIGLGLAVSHGIIERHNGQIEVRSAVGKGSTFTVTVPAVG